MKYSQNADTRKKSLEYLKNKNVEISNEINYFKYFKWDKNYWTFLNLSKIKSIQFKQTVRIIYNVNITENSFLYILLGKKTFQRLPFYLDSSDFLNLTKFLIRPLISLLTYRGKLIMKIF